MTEFLNLWEEDYEEDKMDARRKGLLSEDPYNRTNSNMKDKKYKFMKNKTRITKHIIIQTKRKKITQS